METGYVILTLKFFREEEQWVGECEELGVSTFSDSLDEVREALEDLVMLDLNALESIGERERFFEKNGIEFYPYDHPAPERQYMLIPDNLVESKQVPIGV